MKKLKEVTDKKKTSLLKTIDEKLTETARELGFSLEQRTVKMKQRDKKVWFTSVSLWLFCCFNRGFSSLDSFPPAPSLHLSLPCPGESWTLPSRGSLGGCPGSGLGGPAGCRPGWVTWCSALAAGAELSQAFSLVNLDLPVSPVEEDWKWLCT